MTLQRKERKDENVLKLIEYPAIEEILLELEEETPPVIEKWARRDGGVGVPKFDQKTVVESELEIKAICEKKALRILNLGHPTLVKLKENLASKRRVKLQFEEDPYKAVLEITKHGREQLEKQLQDIDNEEQGKLSLNQRRIEYLTLELEKDRTEKNKTEDKLGYRPRKRTMGMKALYWLGIAVIILGDMFLLVKNTERVGEVPFIFSVFISFAIAASLAVAGHYFGSSAKGRDKIGMIWSGLGALVVLAFILFLRGAAGSSMLMTLANLGMFIIFSVMAYFYEFSNPALSHKYFADAAEVEKLEKETNHLTRHKIQVQKELEGRKVELKDKHKATEEQKVKAYKEQITGEYNYISEQYQQLKQYMISSMSRIEAFYHTQIRNYRSLNQNERVQKGLNRVIMWENSNYVEPLSLPDFEGSSNLSKNSLQLGSIDDTKVIIENPISPNDTNGATNGQIPNLNQSI